MSHVLGDTTNDFVPFVMPFNFPMQNCINPSPQNAIAMYAQNSQTNQCPRQTLRQFLTPSYDHIAAVIMTIPATSPRLLHQLGGSTPLAALPRPNGRPCQSNVTLSRTLAL